MNRRSSKILLLGLGLTFGLSSYSQKQDTLVNGKRFNYISYYGNGKVHALGHMKKDLRVGHWVYFHLNGNKEKEGYYKVYKIVMNIPVEPKEGKPAPNPPKFKSKTVKRSSPYGFWKYWNQEGEALNDDSNS